MNHTIGDKKRTVKDGKCSTIHSCYHPTSFFNYLLKHWRKTSSEQMSNNNICLNCVREKKYMLKLERKLSIQDQSVAAAVKLTETNMHKHSCDLHASIHILSDANSLVDYRKRSPTAFLHILNLVSVIVEAISITNIYGPS